METPFKATFMDSLNVSMWRHYGKFYRGSYGRLFLTFVLSIIQFLLLFPIIYLVRYAFDRILPAGNFRLLLWMGAAVLVLNLANAGTNLWMRYLALKVIKLAIRDYRDELLNRVFAFSRTYYGEVDAARMHSLIVQDTERVDVMSNALVSQVIPALVIGAGVGLVLAYLNWFLFLILLSLGPFLYFIGRSITRKVRKHSQDYRQSFESFSKGILFVLQSLDLTRIQTAEEFEIARQRKLFDEVRVSSGSMSWFQSAYGLVQNTMLSVAGVLILVIGGRAVGLGRMTLGDLLSFYVGLELMRNYMSPAVYMLPHVTAGSQSLAALYKALHVEDPPPYSGRRRIQFKGRVQLESVHFQYNAKPVLRNVNLTLEPEESVALIGPNGAGKSTLTHLILGFYRPQTGHVLIDEYPLEELDVTHLRRQIGVVTQQPIIFSGTIWENITYGALPMSEALVIKSAQLATAHEFIELLPEGYNTLVGENGMALSGGQRQRIAIARALLRKPNLLILDEPTNHMDLESVERLTRNLKCLEGAPTILIISHDFKIARQAQRIYYLEDGQITSKDGLGALPLEKGQSV
jgi:ABC-type bacteriocin/lantibiotic exporter with double-glycine peptidase domain